MAKSDALQLPSVGPMGLAAYLAGQEAAMAAKANQAVVPAVTGTYATASATQQTAIQSSRAPFIVGVTGTNVRLTFTNWYSNASTYTDVDNSASITIKASVERGGTIYPVTFRGSLTATIDGGGHITTDPLGVEIAAGETLYVRTFVTPTTNWYSNRFSYAGAGTGGSVATTDLTPAGSGAIADAANKSLYMPSMITCEPTSTARSFQSIGDSVIHGTGDGNGNSYQGRNTSNAALGGGGWLQRALNGISGLIHSALPSDTLNQFLAVDGHFRRFALSGAATDLIQGYGRNDISNGRTLAQVQADMVTAWKLGAGRGKRVWQTTITPRTTSTDGWVTSTNQTSTANESVRVTVNTWLRAGAPINTSGVAVAIGTAGALLAGNLGHPLTFVFEVANVVETAQNSGLWKPWVNTRTVTDMTTTASGSTITSATAAFTSADLGRTIVITGAGTSGALFSGVITAVYSTTQAGLNTATQTALTNATATLGDSYTRDGTHPDVYGATALGTAFATYVNTVY